MAGVLIHANVFLVLVSEFVSVSIFEYWWVATTDNHCGTSLVAICKIRVAILDLNLQGYMVTLSSVCLKLFGTINLV